MACRGFFTVNEKLVVMPAKQSSTSENSCINVEEKKPQFTYRKPLLLSRNLLSQSYFFDELLCFGFVDLCSWPTDQFFQSVMHLFSELQNGAKVREGARRLNDRGSVRHPFGSIPGTLLGVLPMLEVLGVLADRLKNFQLLKN